VLSIISQSGDLLAMLSENADSLSKEMWELIDQVLSKLPLSEEGERAALEEAVRSALGDAASGMLSRITAAIPGWVGAVLSSIPGVMLFATVYVVSAFTLCTRYEQTVAGLNRYLPSGARRLIAALKKQLTKLGFSYLRAALVLLAVTFFELYLGFRLLGLPYAVLLAAVIALIDLLPVLGIGTVLLPWALFCLLTQRFRLGVGLLIVFLVISLVRQLLEPRIVGKSIGLSPLLTLTSMYAGWYLFGMAGLLLFPAVATLAVKALAYGREAGK
jgi:sporulation integral membrane protein YtvI